MRIPRRHRPIQAPMHANSEVFGGIQFVDVFQSEGSVIAEEAIKRIAGLYAVEKDARGRPPDERVLLRQDRAKPILNDLERWLQAQLPRISGKSELAKAIRYALARMRKLQLLQEVSLNIMA